MKKPVNLFALQKSIRGRTASNKYFRTSANFAKQSLNYLAKNSFNEVGTINKIGYQALKNSLYNNVDPFNLNFGHNPRKGNRKRSDAEFEILKKAHK